MGNLTSFTDDTSDIKCVLREGIISSATQEVNEVADTYCYAQLVY